MIDVIIPVFRGLAATRRCIESALAAEGSEPRELVVIDDASPEPEISAWLRELAASGRITLLAHADNRGFVASVNEGMRLHVERDVVLLNSDTEVPHGWLDRLAHLARREPQVATVTPFSNNATICSYPRALAVNGLPADMDTRSLDALFREHNAGTCVEIPTAVGFCMLITRDALVQVGEFDQEAFGRGYGEEVDFCMRASRAGLRHLLCADLFVFHEGEVSFGGGAAAIRARAQAIVDERYPEFQPVVREFIEREPARPARRKVDLARLQGSSRPRVLMVTHAWGGGVERHVRDLAALLADECEVLVLRPEGGGDVGVRWMRAGEEFEAWFDNDAQWDECVAMLRGIGVSRVHYHHIHSLPPRVLDLARELGVAYDVTLHDYYPICPQYHLSPDGAHPCEAATGAGHCERCLEVRPAQWPMDLDAWRALFRAFLAGAGRVIVPSGDTAARVREFFNGVEPVVWPHPETASVPRRVFKVALIGGQSEMKGARLLEACAQDASRRELPLHFRVLGHVDKPMPLWPASPLSITGSYEEGGLAELIALERPDAFLFLSRVPETFSYTLSAAISTGLPVVAPDLGAFPERLRGYAHQTLLPIGATAPSINDTLLAALGAADTLHRRAAAT